MTRELAKARAKEVAFASSRRELHRPAAARISVPSPV
ncbi:hypothetical protein PPN31119_02084 [Pandoraea pnomenusa]|jgi:hypothetical protein|uniref:Uncharacterized protein n=1 Tax=Pandoraea pnomenusa TaxID=93220 RepID=A0A378YN55_9BURK|nr:Uncharacterised protein [Pandoraea pnomenusa]VVE65923.1 hypothetical protein PPN31119_02084 [Pandoraea pnomenusa]